MTENRPRTRYAADQALKSEVRVTRHWPLVSGIAAVVLAAVLGAVIAYRASNKPFEFDTEWMEEILEARNPVLEIPAQLMNTVGGGLFGVIILPIVIVVLLLILRRKWAALYFAAASILSAGLVQLLKNVFARPRPEDMLVTADIGSFPSGHVANAATMAVVLGFILQRTWVWIAGMVYAILMMLSRTYLGVHWASDTIGGLVLGAGVAVILWAPLAHRLHLERHKPIVVQS
ncbi:undecaprenyl-diphosphatase [Marisediminicola sp. UYEF4]|uniref:phosphatase PAP2 family protein n=1 Tax=Marisediminicola sp. UYEF4 TaxID=1756384 RepID=UPI0033998ECB